MNDKGTRHRLDRYDLQMLRVLAQDGRITKAKLAEAINLSTSPAWERMRRLEAAGLIRGYRAVVDWNAVFARSQTLVEIELRRHTAQEMQRFEARMQQAPEVSHCYATGGGIDYLLIVRSRDIAQYQAFMETLLAEDIGIERYYTYIVTKLIKDGGDLPTEVLTLDLPDDPP